MAIDGPRDRLRRALQRAGRDGADVAELAAATGVSRARVRKHVDALVRAGEARRQRRGRYEWSASAAPRPRPARTVPGAYLPRGVALSMARKVAAAMDARQEVPVRFRAALRLDDDATIADVMTAAGRAGYTARDAVIAADQTHARERRRLVAELVRAGEAWRLPDRATLVLTPIGAARIAAQTDAARVLRATLGMGVAAGRGVGSAANLKAIMTGYLLHDHELAAAGIGLAGDTATSKRADLRRRGVEVPARTVVNARELEPATAAILAARMAGLHEWPRRIAGKVFFIGPATFQPR